MQDIPVMYDTDLKISREIYYTQCSCSFWKRPNVSINRGTMMSLLMLTVKFSKYSISFSLTYTYIVQTHSKYSHTLRILCQITFKRSHCKEQGLCACLFVHAFVCVECVGGEQWPGLMAMGFNKAMGHLTKP